MSMMRWYPLLRGFTRPGRHWVRPWSHPFAHWDDFSRIDQQLCRMNREMDRVFSNIHDTSPLFSPLFERGLQDFASGVIEKDGQKYMQLHFDVSAFNPEEIEIKTKDGKSIEIHAKHEGSSDSGEIKREYHRKFTIPANVNAKEFTSVLSPDGVLCVSAPLKEVEAEPKVEKRMDDLEMSIKHE